MLTASYHITEDTVVKAYATPSNAYYLTLGSPERFLCDIALFVRTPDDIQKLIAGLQELEATMLERNGSYV